MRVLEWTMIRCAFCGTRIQIVPRIWYRLTESNRPERVPQTRAITRSA